jgi:putative hemolysin
VASAAAAIGGASASESIGPWLARVWGWSEPTAEFVAIVVVIVPLTYLNVTIGELVPKALALRHALPILLFSARWLLVCDRILSPIVSFLEFSTHFVLRLLPPWRRKKNSLSGEDLPEGEAAIELDLLSQQTREYVLNLVDLENKRLRDVGLPWSEVVFISYEASIEEVSGVALDSGHTRLPVFKDGDVVGILNTKEFMVLEKAGMEDWRALIRDVVRVDEGSPILRSLRRMQDKRSHLSITYRGGRLSGIVTIEDILEEIIGDLFDEDDDGSLRGVLAASARSRAWRRQEPPSERPAPPRP